MSNILPRLKRLMCRIFDHKRGPLISQNAPYLTGYESPEQFKQWLDRNTYPRSGYCQRCGAPPIGTPTKPSTKDLS